MEDSFANHIAWVVKSYLLAFFRSPVSALNKIVQPKATKISSNTKDYITIVY